MRKIQLTLIQIDNYGPWTVTPEPRREFELQVLQAELFAELERQFGSRGGLVFPTRFDNLLAVTNGISMEKHREIQKVIGQKFPVTISMGVGAATTPYQAQVLATLFLQRVGSSQSAERKLALVGSCVSYPDEDWVQIAHMDINHSALLTDSEPIYDTHLLLQRTHVTLVQKFLRLNALVFYMGGDNIMALSNGLEVSEISDVLADVKAEMGLELKAGVGVAPTAEKAARLASEGLHEIRKSNNKSTIIFKRA
ncbi:MAG: GTP cyclohydrolase IIa [Candidatus Hadarchaeaceae archaeon]